MRELLRTNGSEIWQKLMAMSRGESSKTVRPSSPGGDFDVDARVLSDGTITWGLYVRGKPFSKAARELRDEYGTSARLLCHSFEFQDYSGSYAVWEQSVLGLFED
jgi:hypothetical protein